MKVQGKLTFMWILQSHNFQIILLCFAPGVSISPFLETHGLNYTEKLTSTKWGFLLVATGVCPLLSARHPFLPGPFRVVGACPKSSVSFAAVPSCPRQQSASAIALGSVHPNGKFVFKRSRKNIPEELQHKFSSTGVFVPLLHLVKPHNLSIENWIGETQLPERT